MRERGPRVARLLARLLLPRRDREFILGDLEEIYALRAARDGRGSARRRYMSDVLLSVAARVFPSVGRGGGPRKGPARGGRWASGLLADARAALRTLRREKGFAALVVVTLALGVGSTAVVFGMVDQLLLQPLPGVHDAQRAAYLEFHDPTVPWTNPPGISTPDFDALRRDATLLDGMASYGLNPFKISVGDERPIQVDGDFIYGDFFRVLGVRAAAGRLLTAGETELGSDPLRAVISRRLADRLFGSAARAVGATIRVEDQPVAVVGVAADGFRGVDIAQAVDLWVPFGGLVPMLGASLDGRDGLRGRGAVVHNKIIVRPRAGVSLEAAGAQVREVFREIVRSDADNEGGPYLARLEPRLYPRIGVSPTNRPMVDKSLRLFAGVVLLVLLIACANAANLLLFRNVAHRGAVATRRALGASPIRIGREHLVYSLMLGLLGAGGGLGMGWLLSLSFEGVSTNGWALSAFHGLVPDVRLALFAGLAAVGTTLLFGTVPAALAGRFDLAGGLRQAGGRHTGRLATLRAALAAGQLALTLTLVVGALLLGRTLHELYTVDRGLDMKNVAYVDVSARRLSTRPDAVHRSVVSAVQAVPGVESAGLGRFTMWMVWLRQLRLPDAPAGPRVGTGIVPVTPGWFRVFHVAAVRGRVLDEDDWNPGAPGPASVVVTESLARRLFGKADPVGRTLVAGRAEDPLRVVGVVPNISSVPRPDQPSPNGLFIPYDVAPKLTERPGRFTVVIRADRLDPPLLRRIRSAIEGALPDVPIPEPARASGTVALYHANQVMLGHLLLLLAGLAALLASVGLYGIIAFIVVGRRREFGVRIALGAEASRIAGLVFRYGAVIVGAGTAFGLGGAYVLSRVLRSQLFGVSPLDPASYYGGAALLALVAAAACWVPARRATRVDPAETLRED